MSLKRIAIGLFRSSWEPMRLVIAVPSFVCLVCFFKEQGMDFDRFDMSITESDVQSSTVAGPGEFNVISPIRSGTTKSGDVIAPFKQVIFVATATTRKRVCDGEHLAGNSDVGFQRWHGRQVVGRQTVQRGVWDPDTEPKARLSWMKNGVCHAKGVIAVTPKRGAAPSFQVTRTQKDSAVGRIICARVRWLFQISVQWVKPARGRIGAALGVAVEVVHVHVQR